jgi:hypothetical protein
MTPSEPLDQPPLDPVHQNLSAPVSPAVAEKQANPRAGDAIPEPTASIPELQQTDVTHSESSTPLREWLASVFKPFLEAKHYWSDRRRITADPMILRNSDGRLSSKAYGFAFNGVLLPSIVLAFAYAAVGEIYDLPKTQIEREIDAEREFQRQLEIIAQRDNLNIKQEPSWIYSMSTQQIEDEEKRMLPVIDTLKAKSSLSPSEHAAVDRYVQLLPIPTQRQHTALKKEIADSKMDSAQNELIDLAFKKFSAVLDRWREVIVGAALILNAYLFSWWIRKLRPPLIFDTALTEAHLYTLGVALFFPGMTAAIMDIALDLSIRYRLERPTQILIYVSLGVAAWAFLELFRGGRRLQYVLDQEPKPRTLGRVTWRLLASQLIVGLLVQIAIALVGIPVIRLLSRHA